MCQRQILRVHNFGQTLILTLLCKYKRTPVFVLHLLHTIFRCRHRPYCFYCTMSLHSRSLRSSSSAGISPTSSSSANRRQTCSLKRSKSPVIKPQFFSTLPATNQPTNQLTTPVKQQQQPRTSYSLVESWRAVPLILSFCVAQLCCKISNDRFNYNCIQLYKYNNNNASK